MNVLFRSPISLQKVGSGVAVRLLLLLEEALLVLPIRGVVQWSEMASNNNFWYSEGTADKDTTLASCRGVFQCFEHPVNVFPSADTSEGPSQASDESLVDVCNTETGFSWKLRPGPWMVL